MHDKHDEIIYVGKAISLKNRVRQYFQSSRNKTAKIEKMVSRIARFEYIITDSELEALVLECNLIKEHQPRYNTMLKDDKTYPYIKVTTDEPFPRVLFSRTMKKDKCRYFGPYTSAGAVKDTIDLIHKLWKIRTCSRNLPKDIGKDRPCLNYHIKQCSAPCQGYISEAEYKKSVSEVIEFLDGKYTPVLTMLEEKMMAASDAMEYEQAIEYRELLNSVKQVAQKQKITSQSMEDRDVIAMARDEAERGGVPEVDFVAGVPDSGVPHAMGYANHSGKPLARPFVKYTPTWPRSFMPEDQQVRSRVARMKQIPVPELIEGKKLLFVDDSIVRGTQLRETVDFLYSTGAAEVHMRSACPPIMYPCRYLNFSRGNSAMDLLARRMVQELEGNEGQKHLEEYADSRTERGKCLLHEICAQFGFDSLSYQSLDGLLEAIGLDRDKVCTYCWTGKE